MLAAQNSCVAQGRWHNILGGVGFVNKKLQGLLGVLLLGVLLVCVGCSSGSKSGKLEDGYYHEVVMSVNGVFIPNRQPERFSGCLFF